MKDMDFFWVVTVWFGFAFVWVRVRLRLWCGLDLDWPVWHKVCASILPFGSQCWLSVARYLGLDMKLQLKGRSGEQLYATAEPCVMVNLRVDICHDERQCIFTYRFQSFCSKMVELPSPGMTSVATLKSSILYYSFSCGVSGWLNRWALIALFNLGVFVTHCPWFGSEGDAGKLHFLSAVSRIPPVSVLVYVIDETMSLFWFL